MVTEPPRERVCPDMTKAAPPDDISVVGEITLPPIVIAARDDSCAKSTGAVRVAVTPFETTIFSPAEFVALFTLVNKHHRFLRIAYTGGWVSSVNVTPPSWIVEVGLPASALFNDPASVDVSTPATSTVFPDASVRKLATVCEGPLPSVMDPPKVRVCEPATNVGGVGDGGTLFSEESCGCEAGGNSGTVLAVGLLPTTAKVPELEVMTTIGVLLTVKVSPRLSNVPLTTKLGAELTDGDEDSVFGRTATVTALDPKGKIWIDVGVFVACNAWVADAVITSLLLDVASMDVVVSVRGLVSAGRVASLDRIVSDRVTPTAVPLGAWKAAVESVSLWDCEGFGGCTVDVVAVGIVLPRVLVGVSAAGISVVVERDADEVLIMVVKATTVVW
jgi:hypothetical protein